MNTKILLLLTKHARREFVWLALLSLAFFLMILPISSYIAALPYIQNEWDLNNLEAGVVYSAYLAGYLTSALFIVPLTDRVGPKPVFIGSAALSLLTHILFPIIAENVATAMILRGICGVGLVGMYMPGLRIIAGRFEGSHLGTATGIFVSAQYLANSASLVLTGVLLTVFEWREAYLLLSIIALTGLPIAYKVIWSPTSLGEILSTSGKLDPSVLKITPVRYLIFGYSLHAFQLFTVRYGLPTFLVSILVARGTENGQAIGATVAGIALTVGAIGPMIGGAISDRWGRISTASAIFSLSGLCSLLIGWTGDFPWLIIVVISVVYGWAIAADSPIYTSGIVDSTPNKQIGSAMAMQASLGLLGGVVGPIAFGSILDIAPENYRWALGFGSIAVIAIVAIAALQRLRLIDSDNNRPRSSI